MPDSALQPILELSALGALLQLASPALPVGAFSYSQGLEAAVEAGRVTDAESALSWIGAGLRCVLARYEAPVWVRMQQAVVKEDAPAFLFWNEEFIATRETAELRAETVQMGYSLRQLLRALHDGPLRLLNATADHDLCWPAAHAMAAVQWNIGVQPGLHAYLFGWLENQVSAAIKCVPLGQVAGQRILLGLRVELPSLVTQAMSWPDERLSTQAPGLALMSARHETQYSRLFRS